MIFEALDLKLAGSQTCQLFENDLMTNCKWSKETKSDFIVRI